MASPAEMAASMKANLKEKTGKTLPQWLKLVRASQLERHGQIVSMLKKDHGVTHGFANMITHEHLQSAAAFVGDSELLAAQYAGKKETLKPIYDALLVAVHKLGKDVEVSPKKAYVSLRRSKQFALIQPSTSTRLDLGLCLKGEPNTDRLEASGSFNSMCSHRVRLTSKKDVDSQLRRWLKQAFDLA
jgi:predicted transport protein